MKKELGIIICLCIILGLTSCSNESSSADKAVALDSVSTGVKSQTIEKGMQKKADFPMDPAMFPANIETSTAKVLIDKYHANAITCTLNVLPGSVFHCAATELKAFIDGCDTNNTSDMHLFLSYNKDPNPDSLHLIVCGVDNAGNHIYGANGGKLYAMRLYPYPAKVLLFQTVGTPVLATSGFTRKLKLSNAQRMLTTYNTPAATMNCTATSFLFDAKELRRYLYQAETHQIDHVDFYLAIDYGKLTLIIVGVNAAGKNIYLPGTGGEPELLEHCIPCPTCEKIIQLGTTLERS